MPILRIQVVKRSHEESLPAAKTQDLSDALGRVLGSEPGRTWVRVESLPRAHYAENDVELDDASLPTFVELLLYQVPESAELQHTVERIAEVVAAKLERPVENTHVLVLPEGRGRVAFGGRLRK